MARKKFHPAPKRGAEPPPDDREDRLFLDMMRDLRVRPEKPAPRRDAPALPPPDPEEDADEDAFFLAAMGGLDEHERAPRPSDPIPPPSHREPEPPPKRDDPAESALFLEAMEELDLAPDKDGAGHQKTPRREPGLRRVRAPREPVQVDDSVDLHGLKVEQALQTVTRFLLDAAASSKQSPKRTLLVITGKGHQSEGGVGKLRKAVEQWILRHGKRWVKTYSEAPRAQGGRGAFVLTLR